MTVTILKDVDLDDVIREMQRMLREGIASPAVRRLAEQVRSSDNEKTIRAVFDFVRNTFPYAPDPYKFERFINPNRVAEDYYAGQIHSLDCDDFALLTAAILGSIGYRVRIAILAIESNEFDHATAQVYFRGEWFSLDTSSKDTPMGWIESYNQAVFVDV